MVERRELLITRLGAQGDGVAESETGPVFVPFTLPGERVIADVDGERGSLVQVLEHSPSRVEPVCRHFGVCGGCSVQHISAEGLSQMEARACQSAFSARGLDADVSELIGLSGKRRRAVFSVERTEEGVAIGFHEAASHALVAVAECPVLDPKIVATLPALSALIAPLISKRGDARLIVTLTKSGLDVQLTGSERRLTPDVRTRLASSVSDLQLARFTVDNDVVVETLPPFLSFGSADVVLPPGSFVQSVAEAEHEIARRVVAGCRKGQNGRRSFLRRRCVHVSACGACEGFSI